MISISGLCPELVMGVRNQATLKVCRDNADAVYFSLDRFSLRARATDITTENLKSFVSQAKSYGLKCYLAVNSVIYPEDLQELDEVLDSVSVVDIDALIAWDPAVIKKAEDRGFRIHISTQANVSNWESAEFYKSLGASRVILSRELTLEQIKQIRKNTDMELEVFVHGAMCQAISGRCYLSSYLVGKSANCGECSQPCRWQWTLHGENGEQIDLEGKYLLSTKDLCMIEHIPELVDSGVNAFKVEGRLRNTSYISTVSQCYREALDDYLNGTYTDQKAQFWKEKLGQEYNRGFSTGFYFGTPGPEGLNPESDMNISSVKRESVGIITNYFPKQNAASVDLQEQGIDVGDDIIIEGATTYIEQKVESLVKNRESLSTAEKGHLVGMGVKDKVRKNDRVYKMKKINPIK